MSFTWLKVLLRPSWRVKENTEDQADDGADEEDEEDMKDNSRGLINIMRLDTDIINRWQTIIKIISTRFSFHFASHDARRRRRRRAMQMAIRQFMLAFLTIIISESSSLPNLLSLYLEDAVAVDSRRLRRRSLWIYELIERNCLQSLHNQQQHCFAASAPISRKVKESDLMSMSSSSHHVVIASSYPARTSMTICRMFSFITCEITLIIFLSSSLISISSPLDSYR